VAIISIPEPSYTYTNAKEYSLSKVHCRSAVLFGQALPLSSPASPVIKLGLRHPRKKERKKLKKLVTPGP